jgi:hypothetical protein
MRQNSAKPSQNPRRWGRVVGVTDQAKPIAANRFDPGVRPSDRQLLPKTPDSGAHPIRVTEPLTTLELAKLSETSGSTWVLGQEGQHGEFPLADRQLALSPKRSVRRQVDSEVVNGRVRRHRWPGGPRRQERGRGLKAGQENDHYIGRKQLFHAFVIPGRLSHENDGRLRRRQLAGALTSIRGRSLDLVHPAKRHRPGTRQSSRHNSGPPHELLHESPCILTPMHNWQARRVSQSGLLRCLCLVRWQRICS